MKTVEEVVIVKNVWCNPTMCRYATALLLAARKLKQFQRIDYFNNDDVPDSSQPRDRSTVGAVFKQLQIAKIIEPWRGTVEQQQIWGGLRKSTRKENNGHRNQLWTLCSVALADSWLARNGHTLHAAKPQLELFN